MGKFYLAAFIVFCNLIIYNLQPNHKADIPVLMKKYGIPGVAVAVIKDSKLLQVQSYGHRDKKNQIALDSDTLFQAGSISKTVTAWGVLKLVERGGIDLDASLTNYLPEEYFSFPLTKEVTVRRLLNHTSGLSSQNYSGYPKGHQLPSLIETINGAHGDHRKLRAQNIPGKTFKYTGGGYTLLQFLIEKTSGKSFQKYMEEEILIPLEMTSTTFLLSDEKKRNMSLAYGIFGQELSYRYFVEQAAAGLHTNIKDLASFALNTLAIYQHKSSRNVLDSKTLDQMWQVEGSSYGLGYDVISLQKGIFLAQHTGANPGWRSAMVLLPDLGSACVILTNSDHGGHLIDDVIGNWIASETGHVSFNYKQVQTERKILQCITLNLAFLLGIILFKQTKKRLYSIAWGASGVIWSILFYSSLIHPDGWVLSAFMPWGFHVLTYIILSSCLIGSVLPFLFSPNENKSSK